MNAIFLSIIVATLATLSTVMLGMGQETMTLSAVMLAAAIVSVIFIDGLRWFRLNRLVANAAMVAAAIFSLHNFMQSGSHRQLLAIANLLTYVLLALLFQQKTRRIFGQLAMFSLLQVVVAALLNDRLEFGLLLLVYAVLAQVGAVLFHVYCETDRIGVVTRRRAEAAVPSSDEERLRLLGGPPVVELPDTPETLARRILNWRLAFPLLSLVFATSTFGAVFFYVTPRTGGANWESGGRALRVVGFSPEVTFDEMGRVLLSEARVMRVSFADARTGEPYSVIADPYLRGGAMLKYVPSNGRGEWRQDSETTLITGVVPPPPPNTRDLVRQEVLLEPTGRITLFSLIPVHLSPDTPDDVRLTPNTRELFRERASHRDLTNDYRYTVVTTAFRFGTQMPITPHANRLATDSDRRKMDRLVRWMKFIDGREAFPQLIALADEIVRTQAADGNNYTKAKALETHFLDRDRYRYSLDPAEIRAKRRPGVDPIEDFVGNHRTGHCEYFAAALVLMLRSQGIPARMVVGFHGGEYNYVGNYYVVRNSDAHAWTEVYLKPEEIPAGLINPEERHAGGGWLRLDPTPAASGPEYRRGVLDRATKSFDYARWLWSDYVLRLTPERQRRALESPFALDDEAVAKILSPAAWQEYARNLTKTDATGSSRFRFGWRGGLATVLACLAAYAGYRVARLLPAALRLLRRRRPHVPPRRRRQPVAFYRRLESLLARLGMRRDPPRTQREFAQAARQLLAASAGQSAVAEIPVHVAEAFYLVRFADQSLSEEQLAHIQRCLDQLEHAVSDSDRRNAPS